MSTIHYAGTHPGMVVSSHTTIRTESWF